MDVSCTMSRIMSSHSTNLISSSTGNTSKNFTRKRKGGSTLYMDCEGQQGCKNKTRKTHSQIEKRRRDKMNSFIDELASLVPACKTKSRKLDKLSVLRMAVQHIKTLRGSAANLYKEVNHKLAFLSDEELKHLILRAADGFLFVVDCDRGKILFVSESVYKILNYNQNDLIGQSLFDYLHPKDIAKVKEQLFSADTVPQEKLIDGKSGLVVKTDINPSSLKLCPGVRRSFFCRIKCNQNMEDEDFSSSCSTKNADRKGFRTIHNTGYLKSWSPLDLDENNEPDNNGCNFNCLVAVGRLHSHMVSQPVQNHIRVKPVEFVSRHAVDGKFIFVDQRATAILAYLPQELLGTSFYEYFHEDDISHLTECHRQVLQMREKVNTNCYKLKIKDGSFITLRSCWFSFMNPWTKEVEYIVSINTVVAPSHGRPENSYHQPAASPRTVSHSVLKPEGKPDLQTVPGFPGGSRAGAGKIGRIIEEELLENQRTDFSTVMSEGQKVFEEAVSSVASAAMKNLVVGNIGNMGKEEERDNQGQEYSTTQEVATSVQDEEDVFKALNAAEEDYAVGCGPLSSGQAEGGQDQQKTGVIVDYVAYMSAISGMPSS